MAHLLPICFAPFQDSNGNALAYAQATIYAAETTTPITTYAEYGLINANANPLVADAAGYFPLAYVADSTAYKIVIVDSATSTTYRTILKATAPAALSATGIPRTYEAKTSDYTLVAADNGKLIDFTGARTITANSNAAGITNGFWITIGNADSAGAIQTITPGGGQTIDGQSSYLIDTQYETVTLVSMGAAGWRVAARTSVEALGEVVGINEQTSTAYTLALSDKGKLIIMSNVAANTLTIPTHAAVPFPIGTVVYARQGDIGETTIAASGGVTVNSVGSFRDLVVQHSGVTMTKEGTNVWWLAGELEA